MHAFSLSCYLCILVFGKYVLILFFKAWQFKGWPWNGNPTEIFSKICGFHIKWDEVSLEKNIANWAVHTIQLSRSKRHLDRAKLMLFWEVLDR